MRRLKGYHLLVQNFDYKSTNHNLNQNQQIEHPYLCLPERYEPSVNIVTLTISANKRSKFRLGVHWRSQGGGGARQTRLPPLGSIVFWFFFSFSCSFSRKMVTVTGYPLNLCGWRPSSGIFWIRHIVHLQSKSTNLKISLSECCIDYASPDLYLLTLKSLLLNKLGKE